MSRVRPFGFVLGGALLGLAALAGPARADDAGSEGAKLYDLSIEAPAKVAKGAQGKVTVHINPKGGAEIHKEAPISLALVASDGLTLAKSKFGRGEVKMAGNDASFEIPFTAAAPGKSSIEATLRFYICTDKTCAQQERKASLPVTVQ
jgi:hypothetical protein